MTSTAVSYAYKWVVAAGATFVINMLKLELWVLILLTCCCACGQCCVCGQHCVCGEYYIRIIHVHITYRYCTLSCS